MKISPQDDLYNVNSNNNNKLVLEAGRFSWLTPEKIKEKRDGGIELVDSLKEISEIIMKSEIKEEKNDKLENANINLSFINNKIKKHNKSIENNDFLNRLDSFLDIISFGHIRLKYQTLDDKIYSIASSLEKQPGQTISIINKYVQNPELLQESPHLARSLAKNLSNYKEIDGLFKLYEYFPKDVQHLLISHLNQEEKISIFLKMEDKKLLDYFNGQSLKDVFPNREGKDNKSFGELLFRLHTLYFRYREVKDVGRTVRRIEAEIKDSSLLRKILIEGTDEESLPDRYEGIFDEMKAIEKRIDNQRSKNEKVKENLVKIEEFVLANRESIVRGEIGQESKKGGIKIKAQEYSIPYNLRYNKGTGEITVKLGFLGRGAFKIVKRTLDLSSREMFAEGKEKLKTHASKVNSDKEITCLEKLKGKPNVLQIRHSYTYYRDNTEIRSITTEFCDMGTLESQLEMHSLTWDQKLQIARGLIIGVTQVHDAGIIHRDLTLDNIFLKKTVRDGKEEIEAVVGDFGQSSWDKNDPDKFKPAGRIIYRAPEINTLQESQSGVSFKSDAWSVGLILAQLFTYHRLNEQTHFPPGEISSLIRNVSNPELSPELVDEKIRNLILGLLIRNPSQRMNLDEALADLEHIIQDAASPSH